MVWPSAGSYPLATLKNAEKSSYRRNWRGLVRTDGLTPREEGGLSQGVTHRSHRGGLFPRRAARLRATPGFTLIELLVVTCCFKDADVTAPAETFAAVEDTDSRGYNDGTWVVNWQLNGAAPGSFTWEDPPAMYHVDGDTWSFIDGHVGTHKWTDPGIIADGQKAAKGGTMGAFTGPASGPDYNYVRNGLRFPGWH